MPQLATAYLGSQAAEDAAGQEQTSGRAAIDATTGLADQSKAGLTPFVNNGTSANNYLSALLKPGGALTQPVGTKFTPATFGGVDVNQDPGVKYATDQAQKGFEASAAARGRSLGGSAIKSLDELNQNLGEQQYQSAYTRQYGQFKDAQTLGLESTNQNNQLDETNQGNLFTRLLGLSGQGQGAAGTVANVNDNTGKSISDLITGIGNAGASGTIGSANALTQGVAGTTNTLQQLLMLGT